MLGESQYGVQGLGDRSVEAQVVNSRCEEARGHSPDMPPPCHPPCNLKAQ